MKNILTLMVIAVSLALAVNAQQVVQVPCPANVPAGCQCYQQVTMTAPTAAAPVVRHATSPAPVQRPALGPEEKEMIKAMTALIKQMAATQLPSTASTTPAPSTDPATPTTQQNQVTVITPAVWQEMVSRVTELERGRNAHTVRLNELGERVVNAEKTATNALAEAQKAGANTETLRSLIAAKGTRSERKAAKLLEK